MEKVIYKKDEGDQDNVENKIDFTLDCDCVEHIFNYLCSMCNRLMGIVIIGGK